MVLNKVQHHLLGARGYELLKIMGLKRNSRSFLDFSLHPAARAARMQQSMSLSSRDFTSSFLHTCDPQERCYPPTSSQHCRSLPRAEITPCNLTQPLAAALLPALEARNAAEICLWHWEGGLLMLLPSRRAFMPDLQQLDELSGLTEASLRTGPPSG